MANVCYYRIIYSLRYTLSKEGLRQIIVPLDRLGQSRHVRALAPKERVIDIRQGESFLYRGKPERVHHIEAYRDHIVDRAEFDRRGAPGGRYCYVIDDSLARLAPDAVRDDESASYLSTPSEQLSTGALTPEA